MRYHGHKVMVMSESTSKSKGWMLRDAESAAGMAVGVTRRIAAGQFKARCLALMEEVRELGVEYVITKRGEPIARLVPVPKRERLRLFGHLKGSVVGYGDLVAPVDAAWEALADRDE
jgi:prevent-host-death family protein